MTAALPTAARRIAISATLVAGLVLSPVAPGVETHAPVDAQSASALCAGKAGGLPLVNSSEWRPDDDYSTASCVYARDIPTHRSISATVYWHDVAAADAIGSAMNDRFCDTGEAGDRSRAFAKFDNNGIDAARLGTRRVYATYNFIPAGRRGASRKLAARLIKAVEGSASACPGASSEVDDGTPNRVEIVLTGQRLQDVRDAGGVGSLIGLEGDESYGLVLTDSEGIPVNVGDFVGRRGRVVEMGVSLIGEDGEEVVSITVEIEPEDSVLAGPSAPPEAVDDPDVDDDPDAVEQPSDDDAATVTPEPVEPPAKPPTEGPDDGSGNQMDDLIERVGAELETIKDTGSGLVIVESDEVVALAALAEDQVRSVRLRPGKLEVVPVKSKWPRLFLYPELDRATGKVSVRVKVEPPGRFAVFEIPIPFAVFAKVMPDSARTIEVALDTINDEVRQQGLRPTSIFLDENGIAVEVETAP